MISRSAKLIAILLLLGASAILASKIIGNGRTPDVQQIAGVRSPDSTTIRSEIQFRTIVSEKGHRLVPTNANAIGISAPTEPVPN